MRQPLLRLLLIPVVVLSLFRWNKVFVLTKIDRRETAVIESYLGTLTDGEWIAEFPTVPLKTKKDAEHRPWISVKGINNSSYTTTLNKSFDSASRAPFKSLSSPRDSATRSYPPKRVNDTSSSPRAFVFSSQPSLSEQPNWPQVQVSPQAPDCSCWNHAYTCRNNATEACKDDANKCCKRKIICSHKMGFELSNSLLRKERVKIRVSHFPPTVGANFFAPEKHFRHREIIVFRDLVSSIVSGYLYHKSGRECWRGPHGRRRKDSWNFPLNHLNWTSALSEKDVVPWERITPASPVNGRNICKFLAEETEEVGMAAFSDFALGYWYSVIYSFWHKVQERQDSNFPRTLLVCYEDLSSPTTGTATFHKMMNFLNPGTKYDGFADPPRGKYKGGHATDPDPILRRRLRTIVEKLDRDVFGNWIATTNDAIGCGVTFSNNESTSNQ